MLGRQGSAARDPVEEISVGAFEQCLVAIELPGVETGKMGIGKAAEDQVALPSATMPGTEQ